MDGLLTKLMPLRSCWFFCERALADGRLIVLPPDLKSAGISLSETPPVGPSSSASSSSSAPSIRGAYSSSEAAGRFIDGRFLGTTSPADPAADPPADPAWEDVSDC